MSAYIASLSGFFFLLEWLEGRRFIRALLIERHLYCFTVSAALWFPVLNWEAKLVGVQQSSECVWHYPFG